MLHNVYVLFSNVNDEILVADIEEKEKAEKKFKEAVRGGQTAATVEARWVNISCTQTNATMQFCKNLIVIYSIIINTEDLEFSTTLSHYS